MNGFLQVSHAVLVLPPAHALDDAAFEEADVVHRDELGRLDRHVLVVRAVNLNVEG